MRIIRIERVVVAVIDLEASCEQWSKAGFRIAPNRFSAGAIKIARLQAGAIEIDLCSVEKEGSAPEMLDEAIERGGGIIGWVWGITEGETSGDAANSLMLPVSQDGAPQAVSFEKFLPGVWTGTIATNPDARMRRANIERICETSSNTVNYIEHIVVMTPSLENATAAHEKIGLPCKRIREAAGGIRQAFFKLEQSVLEIVGPRPADPRVWGLAFMCKDIRRAVDVARANGMEATEPKTAIQGGKIARIVNPLDGVAIAYMEPA